MNNNVEQTVYLLDCLESATGTNLIWKATSELLVDFTLPERHHIHVQPFCQCVKEVGNDCEMRCMRNDMIHVSGLALKKRSHFINVCHAGVAELIVPIFSGSRYLGVIFCGPFRRQNGNCTYLQSEEEYCQLPFLTQSRADSLAEIFTIVLKKAHFIVNPQEKDSQDLIEPEQVTDYRIKKALVFLRENFCKNIAIIEISNYCNLSPSRFLHLFKEYTGRSFSDYFQRLRIKEVRRLLLGTGLSMAEIAEECGFSNQSRMSVLFKRYYGISPLSYRNKNLVFRNS